MDGVQIPLTGKKGDPMIVKCEGCGKQYSIDANKIAGESAQFTCRACNHVNRVVKQSSAGNQGPVMAGKEMGRKTRAAQTGKKSPPRIKGIGVRTKMMVLFIGVPVLLMVGASYFFITQMEQLSGLITGDSSKMVTKMAEDIITDKGRAVAREVKLYLETHPNFRKEDFNKTPEFVKIAMQKVGETGYTCLVERETEKHVEYMWVHPNQKIIGVDLEDAMKKALGSKWIRWNKIRSKAWETKGYYLWLDNKEKFCAGIPIEGTPYNIVSATYISEFLKPIEDLHGRANSMTSQTVNTVIYILAAAAILVALTAFFYGNRISGRILKLTDVADRISVGELDAEVDVQSKDEFGALGQAISRMQDSIRISLDRLRRRDR
jgi:HAMP domain-containing protein